jgi:ABC-type nitrate/sulfonate/bicarbonate transport system ATPase subunit
MAHPLRIENLIKSYDGRTVLGPIDLSIAAGAITVIIGRSGCGKTTLLRCLGRLEAPDAGSVTIGGGAAKTQIGGAAKTQNGGDAAKPQNVGYVFQEPRLMPWLTVARNVGFGLTNGTSRNKADAVAEALETVGLPQARRLLPKQLSGGMAQRVALARALAPNPDVILLDEPFSALDPFTREQMQLHLLHLQRHYGATMVLITHDMDEALALGHRVIVLHGPPGRVAGDFTPNLPPATARTSPEFVGWKRKLADLLGSTSTASLKSA